MTTRPPLWTLFSEPDLKKFSMKRVIAFTSLWFAGMMGAALVAFAFKNSTATLMATVLAGTITVFGVKMGLATWLSVKTTEEQDAVAEATAAGTDAPQKPNGIGPAI